MATKSPTPQPANTSPSMGNVKVAATTNGANTPSNKGVKAPKKLSGTPYQGSGQH
jgi:hypothetical protein